MYSLGTPSAGPIVDFFPPFREWIGIHSSIRYKRTESPFYRI
jgi:hypothetical protein